MSRRTMLLVLVILGLLSGTARADRVTALDYYPYDGLWFNVEPDPFGWIEVRFQVFCGNACVEWDQSYYYEPGWHQEPINHNNYHDRNVWYADMGYCCSDGSNWWNYFSGFKHAAWDCGDVRADINQEYIDWGVYADGGYMPGCGIGGSGLTPGPGWGPFPFSALNDGTYAWGVIRNNYLYDYTAQVQYQVGYNIRVTSGYRNPYRNYQVGSTAYLSRHQWGDAIDVKPASAPSGCVSLATWNQLHDAAVNAGGSWFEAYNSDCTHLHVDLRNW